MKKIGLMFLAIVLAIGVMGIGYAAWTDTITVDGTVTTGEVCIEFWSCYLLDEHPGVPDGKPTNPGGDFPTVFPDRNCNDAFEPNAAGKIWWPMDKNVAWGEQLIGNDPSLPGDNDLLEVWLYNTYPCYFNLLGFYVHNCGTIPVKINRVWIDGHPIGPGDLIRFDFDTGNVVVNPDTTLPNEVWDFEIHWGGAVGLQLEPSDNPEISLWMHVLQPCPQGQLDTQHFTITIEAVQWNEYPYGGP